MTKEETSKVLALFSVAGVKFDGDNRLCMASRRNFCSKAQNNFKSEVLALAKEENKWQVLLKQKKELNKMF